MKSLKISFRDLFYIAIIVALCLYLLKSCGGNHVDGAFARLQKEKSEDSARNVEMTKRYDDSVKKLESEKELAKSDLEDSKKDVTALKKTVDKLIADHNREPAPIPFDSTSSIISNKYLNQCVDCFVALKDGERKVSRLLNDVAELNHKNDQLISLKDKHIDSLRLTIIAKEHFYNSMKGLYEYAARPKPHLFAGVEGEYSLPYKNIGGWLLLQDKKGRMYGVNGGLNSLNSYYVGAKAGLKIF